MHSLPKKLIALTFTFGSLALAGSLYAGNMQTISAKVQNTFSAPKKDVIAGDGVYYCDADSCTASMERAKPMARDCRALARVVGPIVSFKVGETALDEAGLAACNKGLK